MKRVIARAKADTPPFFKRLRNIGLVIATVAGTILAAPIALPAVVSTIAGYAALGGTIITAVSQLTIPNESK